VKGFVLKCKEEGSSELRRSSFMCRVRFVEALCCNYLTEIIKKKSWWT
jgi:hypothetical protein